MAITFKQFATYLSAASPAQLDEIWNKIIDDKKAKEEEDENSDKPNTRQSLDAKRKELADKRKKDLETRRAENAMSAKERADARKGALREGRESYSSEDGWKDDAKAAGYKVKKLSGNLMDGDQTWGAFKDDKKMGEFTEQEEGRGGWLIQGERD